MKKKGFVNCTANDKQNEIFISQSFILSILVMISFGCHIELSFKREELQKKNHRSLVMQKDTK
jgi:hypothetical protein